ncbi:hypothetical protein OE88DRAFT_1806718 [Heliocybe sulcata]|uniref:Uncharacterized protein n=1 Tax=Heliocybe sulcata TaxID=5364 RepID=A0A5C3N4M5_9AGAM|nr:hypothetical protein OE88DRAFT_1806718 [Heliocybe sulcata]
MRCFKCPRLEVFVVDLPELAVGLDNGELVTIAQTSPHLMTLRIVVRQTQICMTWKSLTFIAQHLLHLPELEILFDTIPKRDWKTSTPVVTRHKLRRLVLNFSSELNKRETMALARAINALFPFVDVEVSRFTGSDQRDQVIEYLQLLQRVRADHERRLLFE